MNHKLKNKNHK